MAQLFPEWTNKIPLWGALGGLVVPVLAVAGVWYYGSPEYTDVGYAPEQPIPYSHKLHVGEMGMDCRYCHSYVEVSSEANIPPTQTCMNCHKLVGKDLASLEPLRQSLAKNRPVEWVRVHHLGEYAYFSHQPHLRAGVGCVTCHGQVDQMEIVTQAEPLSMGWCLDCHRNPAPHLRPPDQVFNMRWTPPEDQLEVATAMIEEMSLNAPVTDCSGCHR